MKIGLVLEGGSRQTIFTAGVLDALMDENIDFPYVVGVSAGGHAAANFVAKQRGRFRQIIMPSKLREGKKAHVLLDGIQKEFLVLNYESAFGDLPFDFDAFFASKTECEFGVTCAETGRVEFKSEKQNKKRLLDLLNASTSIPMVFPVARLDEKHYVDGCVSDPIPYERAFEMGCDKVVVVSTHYPGEKVTDFRKYQMLLNPMFKRKYPDLFRTFMVRFKRYTKMFAKMELLEKEGKVLILRPEMDLCNLFETNREKLDDSFYLGYRYALKRMEDIKAFMEL